MRTGLFLIPHSPCGILRPMAADPKRPEPKASIEAFKILPQSFGRLPVLAATLVTGGLPQEAFRATGERKSATKPLPDRR